MRTTFIIFFLLVTNAMGSFVVGIGFAEDINQSPGLGGSSTAENINTTAADASDRVGQGSIANPFSGLIQAISTLGDIVPFVFDAPKLFATLGVPDTINALFFSSLYVVVLFDILHVLTGRFNN